MLISGFLTSMVKALNQQTEQAQNGQVIYTGIYLNNA